MSLFVPPLRWLPLGAGRSLGRGLGGLTFRLLRRYREAALRNLDLIYGADLSDKERYDMARAVFRHFGQVGAEFLKLPNLPDDVVERLTVVHGEENLKSALAMQSGVLLITGHFGNWEFMARWLSLHQYPLNVVARDARDPVATKLLQDTRGSNGANVLYRGNSARAVLQCLKKSEIVAILPDQNAADVFVPFLGVRTGTVDGPAVIHLKTGAPLLFAWCIRLDDGRFEITFDSPVVLESTGDKAADVVAVMTEINSRLGCWIRKYPTQWLWLHNRWKATPEVFVNGAREQAAAQAHKRAVTGDTR
jgi:KDO2-lipid IV(A) lauroyltransferase